MKLIDRFEFTNGKAFETWYIEREDAERYNAPECDVIGMMRIDSDDGENGARMTIMRPDEALIQARMLIDAVNKVTSGYEIELKPSDPEVVQDVNL